MTQIAPKHDTPRSFPGQPDANPRAAMGGNEPPLDERIVGDLEEAIDEEPGLRTRINELLKKGAALPVCKSDGDVGRFGDFAKMVTAATQKIEGHHERIKAPYLAATRAIDGKKRNYVESLADVKKAALTKIDAYRAEMRRLEKIEADRVAAELAARRAIEVERVRVENERIEAENAKRRAAEQDGRPFRSSTEFASLPLEPEPEPEPVYVAPAPVAPIRGDYGSVVGVKKVWKHEIESVRQLSNDVLNHPKVVEAMDSVIKGLLRGGARTVKGCRVWEEEQASVR